MKSIKQGIHFLGLLLIALTLAACGSQSSVQETDGPSSSISEQDMSMPDSAAPADLGVLPVQYQKPSYTVNLDASDDLTTDSDDIALKVGATISSSRGPQPLVDVMRILARSKGYSLSWASDVDRKVLVDVNINANDDYHKSIANILRQVDYFHEMVDDTTIVVKFKETRQFQISMPFTKSTFTTGTGGNVLGGSDDDVSADVRGTISLQSNNNEYDLWANIQQNMDKIIRTWNTKTVRGSQATPTATGTGQTATTTNADDGEAARQISTGNSMYLIDKPIGLITVTAPRPLLERLDEYFTSLKREIYKQINIEAKILEVRITNESNIGIDWSQVFKSLSMSGTVEFSDTLWPSSGSFIKSVALDSVNFTMLLNALKEQGDTNILSNPKISVMNGQPAMITVGKSVTYIDKSDRTTDADGYYNFSTSTERILSGVGLALTATVLNDEDIIMNLVPVTSELEEPIEYESFGDNLVGLPVVKVREMNTTVKVRNGEMLVIGGLIDHSADNQSSFAPGVGKIPVVKYLFGKETKIHAKKELIVLLRPTIL